MAESVLVQFRKPGMLYGRAMYLPGEIAGVTKDEAEQFCAGSDPTATLITSLDAAPVNKMVERPVSKKEKHG